MIDLTFDFRRDSNGGDPDQCSNTLASFHQLLWSKRLPSGTSWAMKKQRDNSFCCEVGDFSFVLSSDCMNNSYANTKHWHKLETSIREEGLDPFELRCWVYQYGETIANYMLFPKRIYRSGISIPRRQTINQYRGIKANIGDRFDITLECIRRFYIDRSKEALQLNPLGLALEGTEPYFDLFGDFNGFVQFFLLEDFLCDGAVKEFLPFGDFQRKGRPQDGIEYERYAKACHETNVARSNRIGAWVEENYQ